jgi:hypothetical protein
VRLNKKIGYINEQGQEICSTKYDDILSDVSKFKKGFAIIKMNGKHGFINEQGQEICSPKYDVVYFFVNGFAKVFLDKKIGYINEQGQEIVKPIFDSASNFHNGVATAGINKKYGVIIYYNLGFFKLLCYTIFIMENLERYKHLNKYLKELNCSSKKLSNESGLSESVISRYRSGERTPVKNSEQFNSFKYLFKTSLKFINITSLSTIILYILNNKNNFPAKTMIFKTSLLSP